jgi:hypothetical protein
MIVPAHQVMLPPGSARFDPHAPPKGQWITLLFFLNPEAGRISCMDAWYFLLKSTTTTFPEVSFLVDKSFECENASEYVPGTLPHVLTRRRG